MYVRISDRYGYIYHSVFTRPTDGKQFHYIGQKAKPEINYRYYGSGFRLARLVAKYGAEGNIHVRVIRWCTSQSDLDACEEFYIKKARRDYGEDCINLREGGAPGKQHASTKAKRKKSLAKFWASADGAVMKSIVSAKSAARPKTDRQKALLSLAHTGRKVSEEGRANMRAAQALKQASPGWEATRAKLIAARRARPPLSEMTKLRISLAVNGQILPKKTCPHCGKIGGGGAMTRFHFDNCRDR